MIKEITLQAACPAIRIPAGDAVTLPAGGHFGVMQALGGSITLRSDEGLFRVAPESFPAFGPEVAAMIASESSEGTVDAPFSEELVWDQLRQCFDPEIPLNIVDLGLIYDLQATQAGDGRYEVEVKMTLTAPGCGMGPTIASDAQAKIESIAAVSRAQVDVVWDPQWTAHMISAEGRKVLGLD